MMNENPHTGGTQFAEVAPAAPRNAAALTVERLPDKVRYGAGEEISYDGLAVSYMGLEVTGHVTFSVEEGTAWRAADRERKVTVSYSTPAGPVTAEITLKRKRTLLFLWLALLALVAAIAVGAAWYFATHQEKDGFDVAREDDSGSYIIPLGDRDREEAQALLDDITEKSKITVSVAPEMKRHADGLLRVNFAVAEGNNGFAERLEIIQDGEVVYESGIVQPGYLIEWTQAPNVHAGDATATVHAVNPNTRRDSGNPFSVEVKVVDEK